MTERLVGEVALITGSTHGLGRETARTFAAEGAAVVVTGRNVEAGAAVVSEIEEASGTAIFIAADLTDTSAVEQLFARANERFGPPTVLVNNAAGTDLNRSGDDRALSEMSEEGWARVIDVNLTGVFRVTKIALRGMMAAGHGAIVNVSSYAAQFGLPGLDAYTATKGALNAMTRSIAVEYGTWNIRCNAMQVGVVTVRDEREGRAALDPTKDDRLGAMLLTRPGTPRDIANVALFLASEEAAFITGVVLPVDGGAACKSPMPWLTRRPRLESSDIVKGGGA